MSLDFTKYEVKLDYPAKPTKPKEPKEPHGHPSAIEKQAPEYLKALGEYALAYNEYVAALQKYQEALNKYRAAEAEAFRQFKADAIYDVGLVGYPKAEKVWEKAWEDGHPDGYGAVYDNLVELAALVK